MPVFRVFFTINAHCDVSCATRSEAWAAAQKTAENMLPFEALECFKHSMTFSAVGPREGP
jgi:hypothetical protein